MSRNLVIVESPGKVKSIQKYLDSYVPNDGEASSEKGSKSKDTFKVVSSFGHVRDLPKSGLNLDPENNWQANYQLMPDKAKVINDLQSQAAKADQIFLATDLDREGEAIAWHLKEMIGGEESRFARVVFNEITEAAIHAAFADQGQINQDRVNAQQARRFLDRVVGYKLVPLLYKKIARNLSAGRVQSVAVRLVVEREREIRAFHPEEYWEIFADLARGQEQSGLTFEVVRFKGEKINVPNESEATRVESEIRSSSPAVADISTRKTSSKAPAPFITSTLQQAASTRFGYSVARTMRLAQDLYEAGLITYMRTDSTNVSKDAMNDAASLVKSRFGEEYLPDKPNVYASKSGAQEAHEAIRPSDISLDFDTITKQQPATWRGIRANNKDQAGRLYDLIWRRFVASQMSPARYEQTTVNVEAGEYELRIQGRRTLFKGYTEVALASRSDDKKEVELPVYEKGEPLSILDMESVQHFTKPPARFTEARLVSELEKRGIGRPSTYASIISTIQTRGYVTLREKRFYAERIGEVVTDRLVECFSNLLSYEFTADMETRLDDVSLGKVAWTELLNEYYTDFSEQLVAAEDPETGMKPNSPIPTDISCEKCDRPMAVRIASTGMFLGCTAYSLTGEEQCRETKNLISTESTIESTSDDETDDEVESKRLLEKRKCSVCNSAMDAFLIDESTKLHICGNSYCKGHEIEHGRFHIKGYEGPIVECNKCGSDMQLRDGRFGKYFGCTDETCKNTRKLLKTGEVAAPPVHMEELKVADEDDYFVLREGSAGIFLGASKYPKVRVIRSPRIKELTTHANEIDPKFQYLLSAPSEDDKGNDTFVRFARKTREHYLVSMKGDKETGWRSYLQDGTWQVRQVSKPKSKATNLRRRRPKGKI